MSNFWIFVLLLLGSYLLTFALQMILAIILGILFPPGNPFLIQRWEGRITTFLLLGINLYLFIYLDLSSFWLFIGLFILPAIIASFSKTTSILARARLYGIFDATAVVVLPYLSVILF